MEANGTFLACNSKSVEMSLRFSSLILSKSFIFPPLFSPVFCLPIFSFGSKPAFSRCYRERYDRFFSVIGLAVLVGKLSWLEKCLQVQKSWSKSPPLYGETESGMVAQLNKLSGLWWRQQSQDKSPQLGVCSQDSINVKYKTSDVSAKENNPLCPLGKVRFKKVQLVARQGCLPDRQGNEISLIPLSDFNTLLCYLFIVFYLLWWAETELW